MKLARRAVLHLTAGALMTPAVLSVAKGQAYPSRPVRIIVGFPPGGAADIVARVTAQWLSDRLGHPFVVENRPGAGTNVATESVLKAPADGYTLLFATVSNAINTALYDKLNFDFVHDITPVAGIDRLTYVLVANPSVPFKTVAELIAYAKANPGKLNMAAAAIGSGTHLSGELFRAMTGVNLVSVPYTGSALAFPDLMAGQVQIMFDALTSSLEHITAGKLLALGVTTAKRSERLPNVSTIGETVPGYEASGWLGIVAPKNTPAEIVDKLHGEVREALADPKIKARLHDLGGEPLTLSSAEFGKLIADETDKWGKVIRGANIKPN
jgi:tripartite-type tricarboxylate transporter receptor subunit TctC